MAGHPQAAKLKLTVEPAAHARRLPVLRPPRRGAVRRQGDQPAPAGAQLLRSATTAARSGRCCARRRPVRHLALPDPLTAEVVEARLIARLKPRYNRAGTRADRYCYVRLDVDSAWPRLAIVKDRGPHRRPPRAAAVADDGHARRRGDPGGAAAAALLGAPRPHATSPPPGAAPCAPAQLGVAACPCAGRRRPPGLRRRRRPPRRRRWRAGRTCVVERLTERMRVAGRRAALRGGGARPGPPVGARRRDQAHRPDGEPARPRSLRDAPAATSPGSSIAPASSTSASPAPTAGALPAAPPPAPEPGRPLPRALADEALVLARRSPDPTDASRSASGDRTPRDRRSASAASVRHPDHRRQGQRAGGRRRRSTARRWPRPAGEVVGGAGDDERGRGVEHDDVAVGAVLAAEHPAHDVGVVRRVAADELLVGRRGQARAPPGRR